MDYFYFDSSAIVKNYIPESGTNWVKSIFNAVSQTEIYSASISEVEVIAVLARKRKGNRLAANDALNLMNRLKIDFATAFLVIQISPTLLIQAIELADKYALRGYDAVQLAAALEIYSNLFSLFSGTLSFTFVSADNELNQAAQAEGLNVENPNNFP